ncbi:MAG: hypothetical protein EOM25_00490 [Deltaproteobacteria bacterium]|nr:hypothetical protein [Deltaproteobacteria bacterium]
MKSQSEIIAHDPALRRKVFLAALLAALVLLPLLIWGLHGGKDWVMTQPLVKSVRILGLAMAGIFLTLVPVALFLGWLGLRIAKARVFPLPGARVLRPTIRLTGEEAAARGRLIMILSAMLGLCGLAGAALAMTFIHLMLSGS